MSQRQAKQQRARAVEIGGMERVNKLVNQLNMEKEAAKAVTQELFGIIGKYREVVRLMGEQSKRPDHEPTKEALKQAVEDAENAYKDWHPSQQVASILRHEPVVKPEEDPARGVYSNP